MSDMAEEEKKPIPTDFIAGQNSVILSMLSHIQSDQRANHRELALKVDTGLASIPVMQSDIGAQHRRITGWRHITMRKCGRLWRPTRSANATTVYATMNQTYTASLGNRSTGAGSNIDYAKWNLILSAEVKY